VVWGVPVRLPLVRCQCLPSAYALILAVSAAGFSLHPSLPKCRAYGLSLATGTNAVEALGTAGATRRSAGLGCSLPRGLSLVPAA
jgi:hypothetical protein